MKNKKEIGLGREECFINAERIEDKEKDNASAERQKNKMYNCSGPLHLKVKE